LKIYRKREKALLENVDVEKESELGKEENLKIQGNFHDF
jgi:hypothetical protein